MKRGATQSTCTIQALAQALAGVLWRAVNRSADTLSATVVTCDDAVVSMSTPAAAFKLHVLYNPADVYAFVRRVFSQWGSKSGVVLFVYSLLLTRTLAQTKQDMDDSSATLTATFGHCTQELMNLVLSGHVRARYWLHCYRSRHHA